MEYPISAYVSVAEAAVMLGVSKPRVDQFIRKKRINVITHAGIRLLLKSDVEAFKLLPRKEGKPRKKP